MGAYARARFWDLGSVWLCATYLAVNVYIFTANAYVPDEKIFVGVMRDLKFDSTLGYGFAYWAVSSGIDKIGGPILLRLCSLAAMLVLPVLAFKAARVTSPIAGLLVLLIWFSSPFAWWYGKLISPEPYCLALAAFLIYRALDLSDIPKARIAFVVAGLAVGIKLTMLPIALFVFLAALPRWRLIVQGTTCFVAGFISANPFILFHPTLYIENILALSFPSGHLFIGNLLRIIVMPVTYEWDLVSHAGYAVELWTWPVLLGILALLGWFSPRKEFSILVACLFATIFISAANLRFLGWYAMPMAALLLIALSKCQFRTRSHYAALGLLAVSALVLNTAYNAESVAVKLDQIRAVRENAGVVSCLESHRHEFTSADHLYDVSDPSFRNYNGEIANSLLEDLRRRHMVTQLRQSLVGFDASETLHADERLLAFFDWNQESPPAHTGKSLLLVGDRYRYAPPKRLKPLFGGAGSFQGRYLGRCGYVRLFRI